MLHSKPRYPLVQGFALLGLSKSKGYLRIKQGLLKPTYDGATPYLTSDEVDRYAAQSHPPIEYQKRADATAQA